MREEAAAGRVDGCVRRQVEPGRLGEGHGRVRVAKKLIEKVGMMSITKGEEAFLMVLFGYGIRGISPAFICNTARGACCCGAL